MKEQESTRTQKPARKSPPRPMKITREEIDRAIKQMDEQAIKQVAEREDKPKR